MFDKIADFASQKGYELLKKKGVKCPSCSKPIQLPKELPEAGFQSTVRCSYCSWQGGISGLGSDRFDDGTSGSQEAGYVKKPSSSKIQDAVGITKATWLIPAKKGFNFFMLFALLWLGIVAMVTVGVLVDEPFVNWDSDSSPWVGLLMLSVFWGVGLGMGYAGLRMAFTEILIRIDEGNVVLTRKFFNRQWDRSIARDDVDDVILGVAYKQNDVPVYQLEIVNGDGKNLKFGSNLEKEEKSWMLDQLEMVLRGEKHGSDQVSGGALISEISGKTLQIEKLGHDGFRITRIYRAGPWLLGVGSLMVVGSLVGMAYLWNSYGMGDASGVAVVFDLLFTMVPFLMASIFLLVGVGVVAGGYWSFGRTKKFEFNRGDLCLTVKWRGRSKDQHFLRSDFNQVRRKNSGHVNNDPRYKVVMIGGKQTLAVCDYENGEVADTVEAWLSHWLES